MTEHTDEALATARAPGEILVVDDTPSSLRLLSEILAHEGYSVRQAQDGEMALLTVRSTKPELILLDVSMPIMNGYEVCTHLKADPATHDIPVIFLSALHDVSDKLKGFAAGAVDFITKPYQADEVLMRVQTHLELGRLRVALEARVQERTSALRVMMRTLEDEIAMRRKAEDGLQLAAKVFEASFDGIMVVDGSNNIVSVNPAFTRVTGYARDDVIGRNPRILKSGRHDCAFYDNIWASVVSSGSWTGEVWNRRKEGNVVPMLETITVKHEGETTHYISLLKDVSESKDAQTMINFMSHHDVLTGLPNGQVARSHFELVTAGIKSGDRLAVMCFGIDRFRLINESLGHEAGDQVLKMLAGKLPALLNQYDVMSRHGGDEFIVVAPSAGSAETARALSARLMKAVSEEFEMAGRMIAVTASAGIAFYPDDGKALDDLVRAASNALNQAKKHGAGSCSFFMAEMDAEVQARLEVESRLRNAISRGELALAYQPKVSLNTGEICGAEALLRWNNADLGHVSPAVFIPLAEANGQVMALDAWVLNTACAQIRAWIDSGLGEVKVSVNLSALMFRQDNLFELIEQALNAYAVPAGCVELELTERALVENLDNAIAVLQRLRKMGVRVSVDDFGTGYSSLAYLKRFPIDTLKIDKSFIDDVHVNADDAAIALTIIALSRNLGMSVVAEGVENGEQCSFLRENGCDMIQGYYFSKPVPHDVFESLVREHRTLGSCMA